VSRSTRQAGHLAANAVSLAYLVAASVRIMVHSPGGSPDWLLVHVLLLGAATNAIVTWSAHFAISLLQQPQLPAIATVVRLVGLNLAVLGVLVGVNEDSHVTTVAAAALLVLVIGAHLGTLVRIAHAGRTRRFAPAVRLYWAAACAVLLGVCAGLTLVLGDLSGTWYGRVYLTHVHLGLLGWVTLTVLGTEFTLWPIALRTRMASGLERAATVCLLCCTTGLALLTVGLLCWAQPVAIAGLLLYMIGVAVSLDPFLRTALRRAPHDPATVMLAASTGWLLSGLVYDAVAVSRDADPSTLSAHVGKLAPWLLTGFVIQVLLGALSYLVPVLLGGGPSINRRTAAIVNRWGFVPTVLLNAGVLLLAFGGSAPSRAGWILVAAAIIVFAVSVTSAAVVRASADITL
jgi:nitrite reductase (NO-forming)